MAPKHSQGRTTPALERRANSDALSVNTATAGAILAQVAVTSIQFDARPPWVRSLFSASLIFSLGTVMVSFIASQVSVKIAHELEEGFPNALTRWRRFFVDIGPDMLLTLSIDTYCLGFIAFTCPRLYELDPGLSDWAWWLILFIIFLAVVFMLPVYGLMEVARSNKVAGYRQINSGVDEGHLTTSMSGVPEIVLGALRNTASGVASQYHSNSCSCSAELVAMMAELLKAAQDIAEKLDHFVDDSNALASDI